MTDWLEVTLEDLCIDINDGDWIETKDQGGSDFRLLQVSNIGLGAFRETGKFRYVTAETYERLRCREIRPGMVLVARMPDPVGRAWFVTDLAEPAITSVDVAILEPDETKLSPRYCMYLLNSPQQLAQRAAEASGTTRLRVTRKQLAATVLSVPDLPTQKRVEFVLGSIDDLIENNRRRVDVLEEMARAIYREWFVHFRFPGNEDVTFVDSDLGSIPEGWRSVQSKELMTEGALDIGDGYRAKNAEMVDGQDGLPFLRVANVQEGYLDLTKVDRLPTEYLGRLKSKVARPGDTVLCMKGTVGRMARIPAEAPSMAYSPQVSWWRSLDESVLPPAFLHEWLRSDAFVRQCAAVKGATDMADYVNLKDQRRMVMVVPDERAAKDFATVADPLHRLADQLQANAACLSNLRDMLLPKLMTGQVDVSDLDLDAVVEKAGI